MDRVLYTNTTQIHHGMHVVTDGIKSTTVVTFASDIAKLARQVKQLRVADPVYGYICKPEEDYIL
jgi:hypothetical protein